MDYAESERLMLAREAAYLADLRDRLGDELNPDVLAVMAGLYRAGWRDCREVMQ